MYKISNVKYSKFNNINFTIKMKKILIYINDIFLISTYFHIQ